MTESFPADRFEHTAVDETPALAAPGELQPGMMVGEYRVEAQIGVGGMGIVYAAVHPLIGKRAAIKVMSRERTSDAAAVDRFVQEARSVNQIGHPNIVDVFSFGTLADGRSYYAMEWLQGETLAKRLQRGHLPLPQAIEILLQVCDALEAAHEQGIVHRDLKPENIFLVPVRGGRLLCKLLDFGIAKLLDDEAAGARMTQQGTFVGTPCYMSPEQARGRRVDLRTDLYALGVTAYEMILGRLPFDGESSADVIALHLGTPPPAPSLLWDQIPPAIERMLLSLLDKEPAGRASISEVRGVLAELRESASGQVLLPDGPGSTPRATDPSGQVMVMIEERPRVAAPGAAARTSEPGGSQLPAALPPLNITVQQYHRPRRWPWLLLGAGAIGIAGALLAGRLAQKSEPLPSPAVTVAVAPPTPAAVASPVGPAEVGPTTPAATPTASQPATLVLTLRPTTARVKVDGRTVPNHRGVVRLKLTPEVNHTLNVTGSRRRALNETLSLPAGASVARTISLATTKKAPRWKSKGRDYMLDPFGHPR